MNVLRALRFSWRRFRCRTRDKTIVMSPIASFILQWNVFPFNFILKHDAKGFLFEWNCFPSLARYEYQNWNPKSVCPVWCIFPLFASDNFGKLLESFSSLKVGEAELRNFLGIERWWNVARDFPVKFFVREFSRHFHHGGWSCKFWHTPIYRCSNSSSWFTQHFHNNPHAEQKNVSVFKS